MTSYVVLTPPEASRFDEGAVFIRDGFAFIALILPFLWLLWHRLWFHAAVVLLVSVGLAIASGGLPQWDLLFVLASLLVSVYVALEGNAMRIAGRERRGWTCRGVVDAPDLATAEEIYFAGMEQSSLSERPPERAPLPPTQPLPRKSTSSGPALGLLDMDG
ncbi:DUF2628 domain-containing protein [Hoeflea sp. WL0058]|uniref:DUF2628 domain-containing protein n=1 Tax=Flavimaribacter sediminis TaxID=2865987 RepID=A0AAE3D0B2_9HYPH|nr:DUF2628 domain-containing protein [Flavimaribacter sediminis]MBW8638330.1 DUF2628 domain-containing protein [Flavimaribacter sediminis]